MNLVQHAAVLQLRNPLGRFRVGPSQLELHLQDGVRESCDLIVCQGHVRITEPLGAVLGVVPALRDHAQVGIEGDPHSGVEGDLESGAHVLCSHSGHELLGLDDLDHFADEFFPVLDFGLCRLLLGQHFITLFRDWILVVENLLHLRMIHDEPLLHTGLARPRIPVSLAFTEYHLGIAGPVPSKPVRDGPGRLIESAVIELQLIIIKVNAIGQLRITLPCAGLLQEHGQMFQHSVLDPANVLRPNPILRRAPQEALTCIFVLLCRVIVPKC
mmetsp:Transcript_23552/g.56839  ORF Transcript_23552/g.56839 Transcript_23552/m.56839 type:complete len:271 (+) Transcript_23552:703-1515(+)